MVNVKLECEIERLKKVVISLNNRIGDEYVSGDDDSDNSDIGPSYTTLVNTRHYQRDGSFGNIYYYITDVSLLSQFLWLNE